MKDPDTAGEVWVQGEDEPRPVADPACLLRNVAAAEDDGDTVRASYVPDATTGTRWFADRMIWVQDGERAAAVRDPGVRRRVPRRAGLGRGADLRAGAGGGGAMTALQERADAPAAPVPPVEEPPRIRARRRVSPVRWLVRLAALAGAVLLWHLLTANDVVMWLRFNRLPGPVEVARGVRRPAHARRATTRTWRRAWSASSAASRSPRSLGIGLGILLARSRWLADVLQPLLEVARPIPAIALVPVAILLFPTNEQGIVFITATAAFFPILVSTRHAVRALPTVWEDALLHDGRLAGGGCCRPWCCRASCPASSAGCRSAWASRGSA